MQEKSVFGGLVIFCLLLFTFAVVRAIDPNWDWGDVPAWIGALTALGVVWMAWAAWQTAKATLEASREANEQARRDSIERTRPNVYVELVPGLAGMSAWDIRIANVGASSARALTLDYNPWPDTLDDVATSVKRLFTTPRTLPPGTSLRAIWRIEGDFGNGPAEAGIGRADGVVTVAYTSDDPAHPRYTDAYEISIDGSGLWPVGEAGPDPTGLNGDIRKFYLLGQALVRRISDITR